MWFCVSFQHSTYAVAIKEALLEQRNARIEQTISLITKWHLCESVAGYHTIILHRHVQFEGWFVDFVL
jgi:hypothetical protein